MIPTNFKPYDSIVSIVNQQIKFCSLYMGPTSPLDSVDKHYSGPSGSLNQLSNEKKPIPPSSTTCFNQTSTGTLYGARLNSQLYELLQIYRHPSKIYELAVSLAAQQPSQIIPIKGNGSNNASNTSNSASTKPTASVLNAKAYPEPSPVIGTTQPTSTQTTESKSKFTISDFYKSHILPVLVPFHFCWSPLLFYSNWSVFIVTENMLRMNYSGKSILPRPEGTQLIQFSRFEQNWSNFDWNLT